MPAHHTTYPAKAQAGQRVKPVPKEIVTHSDRGGERTQTPNIMLSAASKSLTSVDRDNVDGEQDGEDIRGTMTS